MPNKPYLRRMCIRLSRRARLSHVRLTGDHQIRLLGARTSTALLLNDSPRCYDDQRIRDIRMPAGWPSGDGLKTKIEAGQYPGIVQTTLDGVNQRDYLEGKTKSARDTFFYYTGATPSAVRYKNWKIYFSMAGACANCGLRGVENYKWAQVDNIKRDPFETAIRFEQETLFG